tara:strand:+ start:199 stop:585 length:387 start_codon:yes stop_codon:yes gene_type:complete
MKIEISNGELFDKLTILGIKLKKIKNKSQLNNILKEWEIINEKATSLISIFEVSGESLFNKIDELKEINKKLWWVIDSIRENEKKQIFDIEFIELARSSYKLNNQRYQIKKDINELTHSELREEKLYS